MTPFPSLDAVSKQEPLARALYNFDHGTEDHLIVFSKVHTFLPSLLPISFDIFLKFKTHLFLEAFHSRPFTMPSNNLIVKTSSAFKFSQFWILNLNHCRLYNP